jgi:class 3 adenylate cyclase/prephenate dehydratase
MSTTPDSTLANPEQLITDLRRQLAESRAEGEEAQRQLAERTIERDEALAQQTATAEVLGVINSSPGDLAPVFDSLLEKALRLCEAAYGNLLVFDGRSFSFASVQGEPDLVEHMRRRRPFEPTPGTALSRIVEGEDVAEIADLLKSHEYHSVPQFRELVDIGGYRSLLEFALRKHKALLGVIAIFRREARPFTDKQIALLQNFAAQAVIAMENARLLTETREALEQQTATAAVLQVINSSPGDLVPVFEAILDKATRLCEARFGALFTRDGARFQHAALHAVPAAYAEFMKNNPPLYTSTSGPGRILAGEQVVHIADLADTDLYREGDPNRRAAVELAGARTILLVPLVKDSVVQGIIAVFRQEVRPFTDKQIALLQNFAAQAVIAMENARLLTETREALEQQTATAEVLQVINSSPGDLAPVFDAILEKAHALCGAANGGLLIRDGEVFRIAAAHGDPSFIEIWQQTYPGRPPEGAPFARIVGGERIVHITDSLADESYRTAPVPIQRLLEAGAIRTLLMVPLRKDGTLLGVITAFRQEVRPFTDKQIALLQNFAAQAVIAMENARLLTETREALEQQTATAEVLQVINSSPGDLTPVFNAMLEKAMRLCEAPFGALRRFDGGVFRAIAVRDVSGAAAVRGDPIAPDPGSASERLVLGEEVVHIPDVVDTEAYRSGVASRLKLVEMTGARTVLWIALRKNDVLLGDLAFYRKEVRPFTGKQIALLQNFAEQAVIAMENARLLDELRQRTDQVAELNRGLEARVAEQVEELGRVGRLKRFLAPQLAELIVSHGDEKILESHRREIVVVFCDLRGYTAFTETAEPEEVLDFLREYHGALGPLVSQFEGTLDQFSGDGIMVFFNDPVPCPDPAERAVKMAMAMRDEAAELIATWLRDGCELGFGVGIAQGYATLGQIGFSERSGYTAIGTVCNLAARLCAEAKHGQILISSRVARAVEAVVKLEDLGNLELKGLRRPVATFNVVQSTSAADARPNSTVVARGPGSN